MNINADAIYGYNPMAGSFGFDLFSIYGSPGSFGAPATVLIDSSVKYANKIGPFTVKVLYANPGTSVKESYQGLIGFERGAFGGNVYGGHQSSEVSVFSLSNLLPGALNSPYVGAKVSDATAYGVNLGYTFNLGSSAAVAATDSLKAPAAAVFSPTLTLSGGYQNLRLTNPADGGYGVGHVVNGGYIIGPVISASGSPVFGVANNAYNGGDKIIDTFFVGLKYRWAPQWTLSMFYGQERNNAFAFGNAAVSPVVSAKSCSSSAFSNCAGYIEGSAFRLDYQWSRRANLYFGVTYSAVHGGAAFGYIHNAMVAPTLGMKYQF
ncbi:hypothetical protein [Bradyrhizobium elkanii]|uniref:hypothetical protein n=1 Tax=Bradyrhizobium elkanii TaxID=29448 RepID=UPI00272BF7BC|nr:hypothetical protein [Bradyrhizobium elkanii]WLA83263.1 hypothetical protein QNJ99_02685 [Bradyrhizobium elkanii]